MISLILFSVICCYVLFRTVEKLILLYRQYPLMEKIPGPPLENKILGHVKYMAVPPEVIPQQTLELAKKYGGILRLWILGYPFVSISKAEYAEIFFTAKTLGTKDSFYRFLHVWLGLGLLTSQGQMWQERRKLITPAFHFSILNAFCETFVKNSLTLIQKLREHQDGAPIDVFVLMHLVALDNICESAMGIHINALLNPKRGYVRAVADASYMITERMNRPWYWNDLFFFLIPPGRKLTRDLNTIFELTEKAINNRRSERTLKKKTVDSTTKSDEVEGKKKLAFLDLLLEASESGSTSLSDEDLRDEVNTFIFEGHDTTASAMSFTIYLLGLHPDIQEKCYQELYGIFKGSDRKPTVDDLQNMKYLEQVIKESLRLFPSVPVISRAVKEDVKLGNFTVPAGATLGMNFYNLHRDPNVFPDPEKFDPDRFSFENSKNRHPFAYVPFSAGARNCIGQKFAMMEEKVVLSYILRYFSLESAHGMEELKVLFSLILRPQKSLDVRVTPRNFKMTPIED